MAGSIVWQMHKGKEILHNDRSNLRKEELILNVNNVLELVKTSGKRDILYLVNNSNTIITSDVKEVIKAVGKELKPYLKKSAVVGTNSSQKILINILATLTGMTIKIFDTVDEAKEWLIK